MEGITENSSVEEDKSKPCENDTDSNLPEIVSESIDKSNGDELNEETLNECSNLTIDENISNPEEVGNPGEISNNEDISNNDDISNNEVISNAGDISINQSGDEESSKNQSDVEMKIADSSTNEASPPPLDNVENEVYNNMNDDVDSTANSEHNEENDEELLNQRPPKRTMDVITIDSDSDDSSICHVESYQATPSEAKKLRKGYSSSESSSSSSEEEEEEEEDEEDSDSDGDSLKNVLITEPSNLLSNPEHANKMSLETEFKLNDCFKSEDLNSEFLSHWSKNESFQSKNLTLHNDPFQICILDEFLSDNSAIENIVNDMNTLEWFRKIMDLYEFHRTADLKELSWQRSIKSLYELLRDKVMKWVAEITNTTLTHISASCALYGPGDHLLLHDDLLEDRKIAFIFYMAPWNIGNSLNDSKTETERTEEGWTKSMGGELEFFSTDASGKPSVAAKTLLPRNNTFAFFKVGNTSFHQVAEVTSFDYPRLTINGWFHGPVEASEEKSKNEEAEKITVEVLTPSDESGLKDWMTSIYLTPKCKQQITQKFEETSEISLVSFFSEHKYTELLSVLQNKTIPWQTNGPMNLRNYQIVPVEKLRELKECDQLKDFLNIITSRDFMNLLQDFTGLSLQSYCKLEIQKWIGGNYSVLPLKEEYSASEIDIIIYFGCPDRLLKGGTITYLLPEERDADPVISVGLKNNALNIVHSEAGLAKFTKYISKISFKEGEQFFMIVCSYRHTSDDK